MIVIAVTTLIVAIVRLWIGLCPKKRSPAELQLRGVFEFGENTEINFRFETLP